MNWIDLSLHASYNTPLPVKWFLQNFFRGQVQKNFHLYLALVLYSSVVYKRTLFVQYSVERIVRHSSEKTEKDDGVQGFNGLEVSSERRYKILDL